MSARFLVQAQREEQKRPHCRCFFLFRQLQLCYTFRNKKRRRVVRHSRRETTQAVRGYKNLSTVSPLSLV